MEHQIVAAGSGALYRTLPPGSDYYWLTCANA